MTDKPTVQAVPAEYGSITPYFAVRGAAQFIDWLKAAFNGVERGRVPLPDGKLGHAEVMLGDSVIQMFDAYDEWPDTPNFTTYYVEDVDAVFAQAIKAGATEITPLWTSAWGDRGGRIRDPFGNIWWLVSHVEDVAPDEGMRRMDEPEYIERMTQAQETFAAAMMRRK